MTVFRIALETFGASPADAFSGRSGYHADGRWHTRGRLLDYGAQSRSLATLERLVHYKRFDSLARHVLYTVDVPNEHIETVLRPPEGWDGIDLLAEAQRIGDAWCDRVVSPALQVPSAVTPGEHNLLLNSHHPRWDWNWVRGPEPFAFDRRLLALVRATRRSG